MADAATLIGTIAGLTTASWGTTGAGTSTLGVILKLTNKETSEEYKVPTSLGGTQGLILFDQGDEVVAEILALDASDKPAKGSSMTLNEVAGFVAESEIAWEHKGLKKINVTVRMFDAMTIGA